MKNEEAANAQAARDRQREQAFQGSFYDSAYDPFAHYNNAFNYYFNDLLRREQETARRYAKAQADDRKFYENVMNAEQNAFFSRGEAWKTYEGYQDENGDWKIRERQQQKETK